MANYCVARWTKYKRADISGLQKEANREVDNPDWYKNAVDLNKQNIYLLRCDDWESEINSIIKDAGVHERPDSVVLVGGIYTASGDWMQAATEAQKMDYFRRCLKFEQSRTQVVSAVIHTDEAGSWHMHTAGVPIVDAPDIKFSLEPKKDRDGNPIMKDGKPVMKEKRVQKRDEWGVPLTHKALSAKVLFGNKVKLSKDQTAFHEACGAPFGLERGECRIDSDESRKHYSEREYAIREREKAVRKAAEEVETAAEKVERARNASKTDYVDAYIDNLKLVPKPLKGLIKDDYKAFETAVMSAQNHAANEANTAARIAREIREKTEKEEQERLERERTEQAERERAEQAERDARMDAIAKRENERLERLQKEVSKSKQGRRAITITLDDSPSASTDYDFGD